MLSMTAIVTAVPRKAIMALTALKRRDVAVGIPNWAKI